MEILWGSDLLIVSNWSSGCYVRSVDFHQTYLLSPCGAACTSGRTKWMWRNVAASKKERHGKPFWAEFAFSSLVWWFRIFYICCLIFVCLEKSVIHPYMSCIVYFITMPHILGTRSQTNFWLSILIWDVIVHIFFAGVEPLTNQWSIGLERERERER